jgi:cobalt/nickel transport system permease protein
MHIHLADQYRHGHSPVHRLDPRTKIVLVLLFILSVSLTPHGAFLAYLIMWALVMVATRLGGLPAGYVLRRAFIALPFALAAVSLPFTVPGEVLWTVPLFGGLDISLEGTVRFLSILMKSWVSVQAAVLLVAVTPFSDLLWGLRALHVPQPLVAIVSFAYRYIFVLSDEVLRLIRARAARSAVVNGRRSGGSLIWRGKVAGRMVGSLMIRSLERSERIYNAMISRGYQGTFRTLSHPHLKRMDYWVLIGGCLILFVLLLGSRLL